MVDLGIMVFRQKNVNGSFKPHLSVKFRSDEGELLTFSIDTTRTPAKYPQPDAYLITHAHSDHNGKSAMLSDRAICSDKTARALEIRHDKTYKGRTMELGASTEVNGVKVSTYPNFHTAGSTAFYWENDVGTRILVTGDVKDASQLPDCDVLITEANYGDPGDTTCYFDDDIQGFTNALQDNACVAFGAYAFGKAQRAVELMRSCGYNGAVEMEEKSLQLTRCLLDDAGDLAGIGESCGDPVCVVPPWDLDKLPSGMTKYVMTGRSDYRYPAIQISDHLDARGLTDMVRELDPELTVVYHPGGHRPGRFASHLNSGGFNAIAIDRISNVLSNEFI
ncbi:MBL fold metallo-hydrolase [Methanolobus halotolerans]|uniref:mRNA 3'-end processing factor n=1 Tax=Methanolobus halotolerans TaxID=2052935 RepID=A0A4E0PVL8_9EURY|nr:MBL fold metallo-hydrolase [Methanolobus halotolerans]TGC08154.1 mRNA 3'-end processing factor [Methanolobus halotolerans]